MYILIGLLVSYALIAFVTGFLFLVKTKVNNWRPIDDPELISTLVGVFWIFVGPVMLVLWICKALDRKAEEIAERYRK